MERIIKGIVEGSCFVIQKCEYTENKNTICINGHEAHIIDKKYEQNINNINITTTLVNTSMYCPLRFYIYMFNDKLKLFGNNTHSIIKYINNADIVITHICSKKCRNKSNTKLNVLINCIDIKLNVDYIDYNDILDIFTNTYIDIRSYDCRLLCFNHRYISSAIKNKEYLQNELLNYIGYNNIIVNKNENYTIVNKGVVHFILNL